MYLLSVLLVSAAVAVNGDGRPSDNDSAVFLSGKCETIVQTGVLHRGIADRKCQEVKTLDDKLNAVYRRRMSASGNPQKLSLRASQRQWITARDARCRLDEPVSITEDDTADCFIQETRQRISAISLAGSADKTRLRRVAGQWVIKKAALADSEGVQAYSSDQLLAFVGNSLVISEKSAAWSVVRGRSVLREHTWLTDQCVSPWIKPGKGNAFDIFCVGGDAFGPGNASMTVTGNGDLRLNWWDGVVLYLRRTQ